MNSQTINTTNYRVLLEQYGIPYRPFHYYWQVGDIQQTQGWTIWLSVIQTQISSLYQKMIPILYEKDIAFRILQDYDTATKLLEGNLGYPILGMIFGIFSTENKNLSEIASMLIEITSEFKGPDIPSAKHLGSIVYARYGAINPILQVDADGQTREYIYAPSGNLITDSYETPFHLPVNIEWPFPKITSPAPIKTSKLLNAKYYTIKNIKPDSKGSVLKALYFKHIWQIKTCIIKQAKYNMIADDMGRDVKDRLQWQLDLYNDLHEIIPMPKILDFFEENRDHYLVMQYIDGISLNEYLELIYKGRCWKFLSGYEKSKILAVAINIIEIIDSLHKKGYVHRDINPDNFMIDKKRNIVLIDMELAYDMKSQTPDPPFKLGTQGHMSPEQFATLTPTIKEDIYGIGALLINCLTTLPAIKINTQDRESKANSIRFFTDSSVWGELVASCCASDPSSRPEISSILSALRSIKESTKTEIVSSSPVSDQESKNSALLKQSLQALANDRLSSNFLWISLFQTEDSDIGNTQISLAIYSSWYNGVAGPLWVVGRASQAGYETGFLHDHCKAAFKYIRSYVINDKTPLSPGLYFGKAGIALSISQNLQAGLFSPDPNIIKTIEACFDQMPLNLSLSDGLSGQGIALIKASRWLDIQFYKPRFDKILETIINTQRPDGSWTLNTDQNQKEDLELGLDNGIAGIIWFLLCYYERLKNESIKQTILNSLEWLQQRGKQTNGFYVWPVSSKSRVVDFWNAGRGLAGISLVFIKAYEIFGDVSYKKIVENSLGSIPANPIRKDVSLGNGLASLAEVYLEAYQVLKDEEWKKRADWIISFLKHTTTRLDGDCIAWQTTFNFTITTELCSGHSGILNLMLRSEHPEKFRHFLTPR